MYEHVKGRRFTAISPPAVFGSWFRLLEMVNGSVSVVSHYCLVRSKSTTKYTLFGYIVFVLSEIEKDLILGLWGTKILLTSKALQHHPSPISANYN
jgi:hypothetical protein